jgi:hypothetical protein
VKSPFVGATVALSPEQCPPANGIASHSAAASILQASAAVVVDVI